MMYARLYTIVIWSMFLLVSLSVTNDARGKICSTESCSASTTVTSSSGNGKAKYVLRKRTSETLNTQIQAHFEAINARELIRWITPSDWDIDFDVSTDHLNRNLIFHAETSRRRALNELLEGLGLQGIFYPEAKLIVITEAKYK